jgi:uncharacterized low-complexity protein
MSDIVHRAPWGFFAIRNNQFTCCHGSVETGQHHPNCPYDKSFGPGGPDWSKVTGGRGYNFHDSTMALRHGPGSKYAENLKAQAETRRSAPAPEVAMGHCKTCVKYRALLDGVCGECRLTATKSAAKVARAGVEGMTGDLFADDLP